jgi:DNA-binding MarR family transcriptional regulator
MTVKHYDAKTFNAGRSIGYLLKMSHSMIHDAQASAFAGHDLSFAQWLVLLKLKEGAAITASDLCRQMRHDNGALTRLLDQLEERGFLERQRSEEDRRVVRLDLTAAGRRKVAELLPLAIDGLNNAVANFSKTEFSELVRLLNKLVDNLKSQEQIRAGGETA